MPFYPYLAFSDNARDAFTRYAEIFGGEAVVLTGADAPADAGMPPEMKDAVIHAALTLPDGSLLMGADDPTGGFDGKNQGMCCNYSAQDVADAKRVFVALSDGGEVQMELSESFFSPAFGMCTDRFGTPWMVVAPQEA